MSADFLDRFSQISRLFRRNHVSHVFIKVLCDPNAMSDIDILIPDSSEELRALEILRKNGFTQKRVSFVQEGRVVCEKDGFPPVDIYPEVVWIGSFKVCDAGRVVSRATIKRVDGIKAYLPSVEDSFYINATHSISHHLRIRKLDAKTNLSLLRKKKFNWRYIHHLASKHGITELIYLFLRLLDLKNAEIDKRVLNEFSESKICEVVDWWIENTKDFGFPIRIPPWLGYALFSFPSMKAMLKEKGVKNAVFTFFMHYVLFFRKFLRGVFSL